MITEETKYRAFIWRTVMAYSEPTWWPVETEPFTHHHDFDSEQAAIDAARKAAVDGKIRIVKAATTYTIAHEEGPQ